MFRMEGQQELEWAKAQKLVISADLVAAAKQQLRFLAEVDRNRYLYDDPILDRAIFRYKNCWLPLLAKHTTAQATEEPLVVPLDCEWIWHCHRLNPVRYKADCEKFSGKTLDNRNVVSSVSIQGIFKKQTQEIWNKMYPNEPYELNMSTYLYENVVENTSENQETTKYDLLSAVKRQSSFFYQVSRPHVNNDLFLEGAVARYKGFLHLIKRNKERFIRRYCVPTYDIDLIWHSHQLQPVSYYKDLVKIIGKVLEHDDTDSNRTKGSKLDVGFSETTKQWEDTFGSRYWRAGAMYRGIVPSPLTTNFSQLDTVSRKVVPSNDYENMIQVSEKMSLEVMVEIVAVKNIPAEHNGSLFVICGRKQPDTRFDTRRKLGVLSETGEKNVTVFQCEPTVELAFELVSYSPSALSTLRPDKLLGTISISLQDLVNPISELSIERWFELVPNFGAVGPKPIYLRIALSFTSPVPTPYELHLVQRRPYSSAMSWACVVDDAGYEIINIQTRDAISAEARNNDLSKKEVIGMTVSGETFVLAEFSETGWSLMNSNWLFQLQRNFKENESLLELTGSRKVIIFPGRKLEYEVRTFENQKVEQNFLTAVEFSEENPYGKAVALLNLESGSLKINEKWLLLPGILVAFLLSSDTLLTNGVAEKGIKAIPKWKGKSGGECDNNDGNLLIGGSCGECAACVDGNVNFVGEVTVDENTEGSVGDYENMKRGCFGPYGGYDSCGGCSGGCGDTYNFKAVNSSTGIGAIPNVVPIEHSEGSVGDSDNKNMKSAFSIRYGGCSHCHGGCSQCHGGCSHCHGG